MVLLKEICQLIRMLFSSTKVDDIQMKPMKYFPFSGYKYMMWCGNLIYRESKPDFGILNDVDKTHETIHLRQAQDCGSWIKYYLSYAWNYLTGNPFAANNSAYYTNKYEVEAYAKETDMTYLSRRQPGFVRLFKLKNRQKLFKESRTSFVFKFKIRCMFKDI